MFVLPSAVRDTEYLVCVFLCHYDQCQFFACEKIVCRCFLWENLLSEDALQNRCSVSQCCLEELVRNRKACPDSIPLTRNLDHVLHLVGVAVAWRQGSRIRDSGKIAKILEEVISPSLSLTPSLLSTILHLVTSLLLVGPHVPECHAHSPRLLWLLCSRGGCEEVETVLKCFRELSEKHPSFVSVSYSSFFQLGVKDGLGLCSGMFLNPAVKV